MGLLLNKKILICVTGGIAVYKAVALVSKLTQAGAEVKVMMTASAMEFVTPLSFQVMSRNDVYYDTFDEKDSSVIAHIDLSRLGRPNHCSTSYCKYYWQTCERHCG